MVTPLLETAPPGGAPDTWTGERRPDPSLFFVGPALGRLLGLIYHLCDNTNDILLLEGEHGAGKTTLLYKIQLDPPDNWLICRVDANPMMHPDQLHNTLAGHVRAMQNAEDMQATLQGAFASLRLQERHPVVIVDDAEQLPISSLMALLRLHETQVNDAPLFSLVLLAESTIEQTLESHQLHAMGTARLHRLELPRIQKEQTGDYIHRFLRIEGITQPIHFEPEQLDRIHRDSEGVPGRINERVIRALRHTGAPAPSRRLPPVLDWLKRIPPITTLTGLTFIILLTLVAIYQDSINALFATAPPSTTDASSEPPLIVLDSRNLDTDQSLSHPLTLPPTPKAAPRPAQARTPPGRAADDSPPSTPLPPPTPEPTQAPTAPAQPVAAEPAAPARQPAVTDQPAADAAPAQPPRRQTTSSASATKEPARKRNRWLLRRDPEEWTIQILATQDEDALLRFVEKRQLDKQAFYFESSRKNRPWFALLYGLYADRDAARRALDRLPEPLRQSGAWPRSLNAVQNEIQRQER